jgi:hypothetical protein
VSDDNTQSENPFARRGFIAAAIVVGVIVLAGVIVLVTSLTSPKGDPVVQPTNTSGPVASGSDKSVCGLEGFEQESTLTEAPATDWELVGTVAAPTDPDGAGPGVIASDGFRSCYAHTAQGALYFTVNFLAIGTDATIRNQLVDLVQNGPGRNAAQEASENSTGESGSGIRAQIAGFKIGSYDGDSATIDLALNTSTGVLVSQPIKLVWEEGDWKMVYSDDGQLPLEPAQLQSLGGYIPWAGA